MIDVVDNSGPGRIAFLSPSGEAQEIQEAHLDYVLMAFELRSKHVKLIGTEDPQRAALMTDHVLHDVERGQHFVAQSDRPMEVPGFLDDPFIGLQSAIVLASLSLHVLSSEKKNPKKFENDVL